MTSGQFSLLMALNRPEPAPLGAVAALLAMDRTTLTAALKPLERRGLIVVSRDAERTAAAGGLALTDDGRALLRAAVPVWRAVDEEVDRLLPVRPPACRKASTGWRGFRRPARPEVG